MKKYVKIRRKNDKNKIDIMNIEQLSITKKSDFYKNFPALQKIINWPTELFIIYEKEEDNTFLLNDLFLNGSDIQLTGIHLLSYDNIYNKIGEFKEAFNKEKISITSENDYDRLKLDFVYNKLINWFSTDKQILCCEPVCRLYKIPLEFN